MALLLAPYNDSMRLGMGFNSYTQTLCIDNAVEIRNKQLVRSDNPSQVVTYSSKIVEHLSEVVSSLNVSHSTSIRKGTVEIAGNGDSINEDKIKSSDLNAVVSVKVVNQTLIVKDDAEFCAMYGVQPGTQRFNDTFGDCYISGFITGGEFTGIVSIRVIDRNKVSSVSSAIKKGLRSAKGAKEFTLDIDSSSSESQNSELLKDTETTITVSWMGGGQVKDPRSAWSLDSVYAAAEAFPMLVSKCPQRTWAILTKYKANRSFVDQTRALSFSPLEYDLVAGYTSTLFDNYMEYKQLVKNVQDMMANPMNYKPRMGKQADFEIGLEVETLVAVRSAFQIEMNKIVKAVDILAKDPHVLKRSKKLTSEPKNAAVRKIIARATGHLDPAAKDAFWEYEKPVEPLPPVLGRYQWVFIQPQTRNTIQQAAERKSSASGSGIPPQYDAWIEDNAKVLKKEVRPDDKDVDYGIEAKARIADLQQEPPRTDGVVPEGFWEWGWVSMDSVEKARAAVTEGEAEEAAAAAQAAGAATNVTPDAASAADKDPAASDAAGPADTSASAQTNPLSVKAMASTTAMAAQGNAQVYQTSSIEKPQPPPAVVYVPPPGYPQWGPQYGYPPALPYGQPGYPYGPQGYPLVPVGYAAPPPGYIPAATMPQGNQAQAGTNNDVAKSDPKKSGEAKANADGSNSGVKDKTTAVDEDQPVRHRLPYQENEPLALDFDLMISPEIWTNLLPIAKEDAPVVSAATGSVMPGSLASEFPSVPTDDILDIRRRAAEKSAQKLEILSAAYGVVDCTDNLQEMVGPDGTLVIDTLKMEDLLSGHSKLQPQTLKPEERYLAFVFQYADQPMQLFVNDPSSSTRIHTISPTSKGYSVVTASDFNKNTWCTVALVFGGKQITDIGAINAVLSEIEKNFNDGEGTRHVNITPTLVKEDPMKDRVKTGIIFYQTRPNGQVRCAVGVENGTPCMLTDRLLPDVMDPHQKAKLDADFVKLKKETSDQLDKKDKQLRDNEDSFAAKEEKLKASLDQKEVQLGLVQASFDKLVQAQKAEEAWKLVAVPKEENTVPTYPGQADQRVSDSLASRWNGASVQLLHNHSRMVFDIGGFNGKVWLYREALWKHVNQTLKLEACGDTKGQKYWWMVLVHDGKDALEMIQNKLFVKPKNPNNEGQQWTILGGSDKYSIRIRTKKWNDCYMTTNTDGTTEIYGAQMASDKSFSEWQVMVVALPSQ